MEGAAVQNIADLAQRKPIELGELLLRPTDWVAEDPQSLIKPGPAAKAFGVVTLGAVRDYLRANRDELKLETLTIHVESPNRVTIGGPLRERARDRELFVTATADDLANGFVNKFIPQTDFIIGLQTRFIADDARAALLRTVGSIKSEAVRTALDDGISQTVEAKAGVALKSEITLPNPVTLTPFRTFREVLQPSSIFALRAQEGRSGPELGLFEADGGAWKLHAIGRVRDWLEIELKDLAPTVAILG